MMFKTILTIFLITLLLIGCTDNDNQRNNEMIDIDESENGQHNFQVTEQSDDLIGEKENQIRRVSLEEIEMHHNQWTNDYYDLLGQYNSSLTQEITEHGYAHKLNLEYDISESKVLKCSSDIIKENSLIDLTIKNEWNAKGLIDMSKEADLFRLYTKYTEENVRLKVINNRIDHIIFANEYDGDVLNEISTDAHVEGIKEKLGEPDYYCKSLDVYGYLFDKFYLFFYGQGEINQISVYARNDDENTEVANLLSILNEQGAIKNAETMNNFKAFEFQLDISSKIIYGYEKAGCIIEIDDSQTVITLFSPASTYDVSNVENINDIKVVIHEHRNAVVELELYRICIENYLMGKSVPSDIKLGQGFQGSENFVVSPNSDFMAYMKSDTIDDNYPVIYIMSIENDDVRKEIMVSSDVNAIYWVNEGYLVYDSESIGFIYDIINDKLVPTPQDLFGSKYIITNVGESYIESRLID